MICVIQQQVPLPLPCFNFAQITTLSLTRVELITLNYQFKFIKLTKYNKNIVFIVLTFITLEELKE